MARGVSVRPAAGSRYPSARNVYPSSSEARYGWNRVDIPGGRSLWIKLVIALTSLSIVGLLFMILGAVFVKQAYDSYREHGMSLSLIWCIIGMVTGFMMIVGAVILSQLILSNKWRTNQQPVYGPTVRYIPQRRRNGSDISEPRIEIEFPGPPPSYEESLTTYVASIHIISNGDMSIPGNHHTTITGYYGNAPIPSNLSPPSYSEINLTEAAKAPPYSPVSDTQS